MHGLVSIQAVEAFGGDDTALISLSSFWEEKAG